MNPYTTISLYIRFSYTFQLLSELIIYKNENRLQKKKMNQIFNVENNILRLNFFIVNHNEKYTIAHGTKENLTLETQSIFDIYQILPLLGQVNL